MENVSGMVKGTMRGKFNAILAGLKNAGFRVAVRLLNAMYYGVPQSRERLFFVGLRSDVPGKYEWPERRGRITVRQAIQDIAMELGDKPFNPQTKTAQAMLTVRPGSSQDQHHGHVKLAYDKPGPTLCHDFLGYFHFWHPEIHRPLNLREWSRLASFPDDFQWTDRKQDACQCIGNAVMPKQMQAVAGQLRKVLEA